MRPGSEAAIALALGRIIVEENLGRVGSHRDHAHLYRDVSVETLAESAGLSAEELRRLAAQWPGPTGLCVFTRGCGVGNPCRFGRLAT